MVNAQKWLNEKFSHHQQRREVKFLSIMNRPGQDKFDQVNQTYLFYNTQLEGELDLKDFVKLEYLNIGGGVNTSSYQALRKIEISEYLLETLVIHNFNEKVEITWPLLLRVGRDEESPNSQHEVPKVKQLTTLIVHNCPDFTIPKIFNRVSWGYLTKLKKLIIFKCPGLYGLDLTDNKELTYLDCSSCCRLKEIGGLEKLTKLTALKVNNCSQLTGLSGISNLTKLSELFAANCPSLVAVDDINKLISLKEVDFSHSYRLNLVEWRDKKGNWTIDGLSSQLSSKKTELEKLINEAKSKVAEYRIELVLKTQKKNSHESWWLYFKSTWTLQTNGERRKF